MTEKEPENPTAGFKDIIESKDRKIEELEIRVASLEELIEGLVNLQPIPELTKTRSV